MNSALPSLTFLS